MPEPQEISEIQLQIPTFFSPVKTFRSEPRFLRGTHRTAASSPFRKAAAGKGPAGKGPAARRPTNPHPSLENQLPRSRGARARLRALARDLTLPSSLCGGHMSNPFLALGEDSDDEVPAKAAPAGPVKPATQVNNRKPTSSAAHQPKREELKKQEEGAFRHLPIRF